MKIIIIAVGKISEISPESKLINEYLKRLSWKVEIKQIEQDANVKKLAEQMLRAVPKGSRSILLDRGGRNYSSEEFASYLNKLSVAGESSLAFFIGGDIGFDKTIYNSVRDSVSLGRMTYPHKLVRVIFAEQLYRAWSILNNHPYHK